MTKRTHRPPGTILAGALALLLSAGCATSGGSGGNPSGLGESSLEDLTPGLRVEIDGFLQEDGTVKATKVAIEEPAEYPEVKGTIAAIDLDRREVRIPPLTIRFDDLTDIDDDETETDSYRFEELQVGWRLEVEVEAQEDGSLLAIDAAVDRVPDENKVGVIELEGFIETVDGATDEDIRFPSVLGVRCRVDFATPIESRTGRRTARRAVSKDDDRGETTFRLELGETELYIGGELQYENEFRDNYDLNDDNDRDTGTLEAQGTVELDWLITPDAYAFLKLTSGRAEVIYDEDRDLDLGEDTRVIEAYGYWQYIADLPIAVQIGRQRFEDPREWFYDEEIDGVRLLWFDGPYEVEYSVSKFLRDNHLRDEVVNQFFTVSYEYAQKSRVYFRIVDLQDDSAEDNSPFYVSLSSVGRWKGDRQYVRYWAQYAYVDGVIGPQEISGHAIDVGASLQWRKATLRPYVFGGVAWASGDDDTTGRKSHAFRQSGYEDNNDKLFGVASYRYYGELFRPELSNLIVWTGGVGIRPVQWMSVDFVYHRYFQDEAVAQLGRSRLRRDPDGNDEDLGHEFDLVVGLDKLWNRFDVELDLGYFEPGDAFETADDSAFWVALQLEFNF